jgi:hypothetical protein
MWRFEDAGDRERRRAAMEADPRWQVFRAKAAPYVLEMRSRILQADALLAAALMLVPGAAMAAAPTRASTRSFRRARARRARGRARMAWALRSSLRSSWSSWRRSPAAISSATASSGRTSSRSGSMSRWSRSARRSRRRARSPCGSMSSSTCCRRRDDASLPSWPRPSPFYGSLVLALGGASVAALVGGTSTVLGLPESLRFADLRHRRRADARSSCSGGRRWRSPGLRRSPRW